MAVIASTIAQLATGVAARLQDPTYIFWQQRYEIFSSLAEALADLILLVGRPTITFNTFITLTPNTVWQQLPPNVIALTNLRGDSYNLWKTDLHTMDYLQGSWGCYDDQTDVLTDHGWKRFCELNGSERIASLSPEGYLEYQSPTKYHRYPFRGELRTFVGQSVDLAVTPNHNMYVCSPGLDKEKWQLIRADEPIPDHSKMKRDALWEGVEQKSIAIAGEVVDMDTWLEFLGYFLSEGSTTSSITTRKRQVVKYKTKSGIKEGVLGERPQTSYIVQLSQKKERNLEKINSCVKRLPFSFFRRTSKDGKVTWTLNRKALYRELVHFGKSHQKHIPDYVKGLSRRQLRILYDALMLGDGHICEGSATYYTSSPQLADDMQELALKVGYAASIGMTNRRGKKVGKNGVVRQLEYGVGISRVSKQPRKEQGWGNSTIPYNGTVYCVTVPNRVIYVRRNGFAVWCGNSDWESDIADTPRRWGPLGWTKFFVHPAPSTPIQMIAVGVANPITTPWPPTGSESSPFHEEIDVALQLYAAAYARIKDLGDDFYEGQALYQQYLDIAARASNIEDRRDPLIFTRALGSTTAPSLVSMR